MNNIVTFVLDLKNLLSSKMAGAATTAQSSLGNIATAASGMSRSIAVSSVSAANSIGGIGSAATQSARQVNSLGGALERLHANRGSMGGRSWLMGGALAAGLGFGALNVIKAGADQQRDVVGLSTFMGKQGAKTFYNDVAQEARLTPFVTHDLMSADRMLISTGMNAKRAQFDIHNLANAVAGVGGSNYVLERMSQHMQAIASMGHANYMYLKEFGTNGINIYKLLSDAAGKTIVPQHGLVVSFQAIENALDHAAKKGGLFYNALFDQSQTIWGKWSTLMDDLLISSGKIVDSQSKGITGLLDLFDSYAQRLPELADQWAPTITNITEHIISLTGKLIELAKWFYNNWHWIKYVAEAAIALNIGIKALYLTAAIYNGIMTLSAIRTALFGAATVAAATSTAATTPILVGTTAAFGGFTTATYSAATAVTALDTAMTATPWGWIALAIAGVGLAIAKLVSDSEGAGSKIAKNLAPPVGSKYGIDGSNYKNPLIGGTFVQDTSTYDLVKVVDRIDDTVGHLEKVYTGKKIWVPAADPNAIMYASPQFAYSPFDQNADAMRGKQMDQLGSDAGISIAGGGRREININFKNFVEHLEIKSDTVKEGLKEMEGELKNILYRILAGIPA